MERSDLRERLLEIAEEIFAKRGFAEAGVREITSQAGCNVAAVNYHFGGKKKLYLAVIKERWLPRTRKVKEEFLKNLKSTHQGLEGVIVALIRAFFENPFSERERWRHRRLLAQELAQPTEAFDLMLAEGLRPLLEAIGEALKAHLPADLSERKVRLAVFSLIGQILYFNFAWPIVRDFLREPSSENLKDEIIEHIKAFSLMGLKGLAA
ncbi:CerR family C-terminal domain-containing protein [Thermosulfurimonas dismutans]|uniref:Putative transcriptional regulator for fatty acid degradation FadQ, TetR family n=1 Tax=Thermosulfurimonas dismutans TaxID=999894 RepID=A0A179D4X0_9BACT|nr:CerR family C-terminal domain-containing protein [Thermosulfurimonas dismutans]OAQ21140.1 putative transcriptional regulator for fatty acid degradation FadQ, TetR family [Thermosulfurimonas dismutans]